jgi:hypothetical protein
MRPAGGPPFAVTRPITMYGRLRIQSPMIAVLPLHCPACGVGVDVQVVTWAKTTNAAPQTYRCPVCKTDNRGDLPGRVAFVTTRQEPVRKA